MKKNKITDITVFVISTNEETISQTIKSLEDQDSEFEIVIIENIFPMHAAFQEMPNRCKTKYFIQVDADMILKPYAVNFLYLKIKKSPFWLYRVSGSLIEEGFGIGGAVKCWKTNIFKYFKFKDVRTVDRDFHKRIRRIGLNIKHNKEVIGIHKPRHSVFSNYLKTKSDIEKWKFLKRNYNLYAKDLLSKIIKFKDENDGIKLLGYIFGVLTNYEILNKSKNTYLEKKFYDSYLIHSNKKNFKLNNNDETEFINLIQHLYNDFSCVDTDARKKLFNIARKKYDIKLNYQEFMSI